VERAECRTVCSEWSVLRVEGVCSEWSVLSVGRCVVCGASCV
jgi:hypothetical protein